MVSFFFLSFLVVTKAPQSSSSVCFVSEASFVAAAGCSRLPKSNPPGVLFGVSFSAPDDQWLLLLSSFELLPVSQLPAQPPRLKPFDCVAGASEPASRCGGGSFKLTS